MDWLVISAQACIWYLPVGGVRAGTASFSCEETRTRTWKSSGTICQLSKGCFGSHLVMGVVGRQICVSDGFASRFFAGVSLVHYLLFSKGKIWKHKTIPWAFLSKTIKLRTRQPPSSTNSDSLCVAEEPSPSRKRKPQDRVLSRWSRSERPGPSLQISDRKGTYLFHKWETKDSD